MTPAQTQKLRLLYAERDYATDLYHECLQRKAPDAERHIAEAACVATWDALVAFVATT